VIIRGNPWLVFSNLRAAALQQDSVAPAAVELADSLATTYFAESGLPQKRQAGYVFREDHALEGPYAIGFRLAGQFLLQGRADALCPRCLGDAKADLRNPGVGLAR
jgi:hypothetical protein